MRLIMTVSFLVALLASGAVWAAPDVAIEAYTSPAWVSRGGKLEPLNVATQLKAGDEIVTGDGGRTMLRLGDDSIVKLGENAKFVIEATEQRWGTARKVFRASLKLVTGAFRFTTAALAKSRSDRDVTIHVGAVTAGIRGTDIWGKASPDRDFVVLLEGKADFKRGNEPAVTLDKPLSIFDAPAGAPIPPVTSVPAEVVQKFAQETEINPGSGGSRAGAQWKVTVVVAPEQSEALAAFDKLREAGYPAAISPFQREGKTLYGVRIANLASEDDAVALALRLKLRLGYETAAISK